MPDYQNLVWLRDIDCYTTLYRYDRTIANLPLEMQTPWMLDHFFDMDYNDWVAAMENIECVMNPDIETLMLQYDMIS